MLSIILTHTFTQDVTTFLAVFIIISPAFGFAFAALQPSSFTSIDGAAAPDPAWATIFRYPGAKCTAE